MEQPVFRQKSMEHISSPEQLNDYLHVTTPALWGVLTAVIALLVALIIWSSVTAVESFAAGTAQVENGMMTVTFNDPTKAGHVSTGMDVMVGKLQMSILTVGTDDSGNILAVAKTNLPDGTYPAKVGYDSTQILSLLLN